MSSINDLIAKCKKISEDKNADEALKAHCANILQKITELDLDETINSIDITLQNIIDFEKSHPNDKKDSFFEDIKNKIKDEISTDKNAFKFELANVVKVALENQLSTLNDCKNKINIGEKIHRPEFIDCINFYNKQSGIGPIASPTNMQFTKKDYANDLELYKSYKEGIEKFKPTRVMRFIHTATTFFARIFGVRVMYDKEIQVYSELQRKFKLLEQNPYFSAITNQVAMNEYNKYNGEIDKTNTKIKEIKETIAKIQKQPADKKNIPENQAASELADLSETPEYPFRTRSRTI
jgi:hypothetical protein